MSIIETLQAKDRQEQLTHEIGNFMFDLLNTPLPDSQNVRFEYPKCPFCKGRPRLIKVPGAEKLLQIRGGSPLALSIPKYKVQTCCSATYKVKHEGLSQRQLRQFREAQNVSSRR